jgi:hypothetical protein
MNGHRIELERLVRARVERVREVLTDVAHADETLSGVENVELITEGPYRVGTPLIQRVDQGRFRGSPA